MTDLQTPPSRGRLGTGILIAVLLASLAIFGAGLLFILMGGPDPLVEAGDRFMTALRDGNYAQAYRQTAPNLQRGLGSVEGLRAAVVGYRPTDWRWAEPAIPDSEGFLEGAATFPVDPVGSAELRFRKIDGQWRVTEFELN